MPARSLRLSMQNNFYIRRKLRSMLVIICVCIAIGIVYEPVSSGKLSFLGPIVGLVVGAALALFEILFPMNFMRRWSFTLSVLTKAVIYICLIWLAFLASTFVFGYFQGLTLTDFYNEIWSSSTITKVVVASAGFVCIVFFRQLSQLLGPGTLMRYLFGSYHRPRKEERIFMFLDLKDSTAIAERLDIDAYYSFLNDFFHDIAGPILSTKAQIYQYIGDEVVLTWPMAEGLQDANCIRVFYEIDNVIFKHRHFYLARYGLSPEYKAGIYGGEVIRAEIGDLKRDLIYNGDVLNTTARIRSECNRFNTRLLAASSIIKQLELPKGIIAENVGAVSLKGKRNPVGLVSLRSSEEIIKQEQVVNNIKV